MMEDEKIRLQKYLALAGLGSRRHCEELISQGAVSVKGQGQAKLGDRVNPLTDVVMVNGKKVRADEVTTFLFFKPRGFTCNEDPLHPDQCISKLHPDIAAFPVLVGLEKDASGLILLSNDGRLHQALKPRLEMMEERFLIGLNQALDESQRQHLLKGVTLDNRKLILQSCNKLKMNRGRVIYEVMIVGHKDKAITKMFSAVGRTIHRRTRVEVAGIQDTLLEKGKGRPLTFKEIQKLYLAAGIEGDHR